VDLREIIAMIRISGNLSLTETSQTGCSLGIRLEFCRKGRIATKPLEWCGCAKSQPHTTWHLDEVYLKIDGRMVYLWRAVDAESEVLDVLVRKEQTGGIETHAQAFEEIRLCPRQARHG